MKQIILLQVSSAHATQTIQPSKRDRGIEFQVPKTSFANQVQVQESPSLKSKLTKSTSVENFHNTDRSIATSVMNSVLGNDLALRVNSLNVALRGNDMDDAGTVNVIENTCSVSMNSFISSPEERNNKGTSRIIITDNTDLKPQTISPRLKLYEEQLRIEIYKWYNDVPVLPDQQESAKDFREYVVNSLIQRLVDNSHKVKDEGYGVIVRRLVQNCIYNLPMWCPGDKDEQSLFKKRMGDNLLDKILFLNEKIFEINHVSKFDVRRSEVTDLADDNYSIAGTSKTMDVEICRISEERGIEEMISLYVTHWINNDVIRIYPNYTKYDFMNLLFKALEPFFGQRNNITLATLRRRIFEILDELPVTVCSDTDKALKLYKLAEDLADLIRQHGSLNERNLTMARTDSNDTCKSTISHRQFIHLIKVEVRDCLQRFRIETNEDRIDNITEILAKELDTISTETKSNKPITALYRLLEKTVVTKEELSDVVFYLINSVRTFPLTYQVQTCQGMGLNIENSPVPNTVIVLRNEKGENSKKRETPTSSTLNTSTREPESEENLAEAYREMPGQSTPKRKRQYTSFAPDVSAITIDEDLPATHKVPRLSPEAYAYLDAVEIEIEKWIDDLTEIQFQTDEDLKFKSVMIKDLAADVLDRAKFKQLNSQKTTDAEDLEHVRYIIFRWIWRISDVHSFARDDQFDNKILRLVHALHKIPVPDLITPYYGNRRDMKIDADQIPTGIDILEDEISIFLNERAPDIFVDKNKSTRNRLIHELATNVRGYVINEENPTPKIDTEIEEWFQKAAKPETNTTEIKNLLKKRIARVPISVFQPYTKPRVQVDLEEATANAMDWIKEQSFYQQCTPKDKKEQEMRTAEMVKSLLELNRLLPESAASAEHKTNQILTELVDHLKLFPVSNGQRMESEYSFEEMRKIAKELVKHLSKLEKVRKLARLEAATPEMGDLVEEWLQRIPIKIKTADAQVKFLELKAKFIASLKTLKNLQSERQADVHDNLLKSEIKNFLQACPLHERAPNTEKERLERAEELIEMIKSTGEKTMRGSNPPCVCPTPADKQLREFLKENLQKFQTGDTIAKEAFTERLFKELENVNLQPCQMQNCQLSCKDVTQTPNQRINMNRYKEELVIIKSISEWLKGLPLIDEFYSPQNQERSKIISQLAEKIYNLVNSPETAGNLNLSLFELILEWIPKIPIKQEYQKQSMKEKMSHALKNRIEKELNLHRTAQSNLGQRQEQSYSNANDSSARAQDSRSDSQKLEDFVETFMTMNRNIDISDEVIRDAYAYKLLQALKIAIKQLKEPATDRYELYEAMGNVSMPGNTSVLRYTRELRLIKEIKEWMSLLPTVPADEKENRWRSRQCNELAKYIADIHDVQADDPWHPYQKDLTQKIRPILDHILKPGHEEEYNQMTYNLLKRQLDVANEFYPMTQPPYTESQNATYFDKSAALHKHYTSQDESLEYGGFSANVPHSSSLTKGHVRRHPKLIKPTDLLFQAIENWSKSVPIEGDEETKTSIKDSLVQSLLKKVGQLNMDPNIYDDDLLYQAMLTDEIEEILDILPQNSMLQTNKERLKNKLVDDIMEANAILKNMNAGESYKKKLEDNIGAALPTPANEDQKAAMDFVKTVIAEDFILNQFQNGDDELKTQYDDKVISGLSNVMAASVFSQSNVSDIHDSIRNELESVPVPNNDAIALEVEEIKTKHVIAEWFEGLPLVSPRNHQEVLDRDRIQSLLAKRLHEIEKDESDPEFAMMAIITKWLFKLPFHEGQEKFVGDMTQNLIAKLRITKDNRHATLKNVTGHFPRYLANDQIERQQGIMTSNKTSSNVDYTKISEIPAYKNCTEIIFERVQHWCQQLPLEGSAEEEKNNELKAKLTTKILFKIGELNRNDLIFNDEDLYREELTEALDKILSSLPQDDVLTRNKATLIRNLVHDIVEIRPCIKEEKDRHHYKQQLHNTVTQVVKTPQNISEEQKALRENFQEEIVDDFIEYNYHKDDQGKLSYRDKILDESQNFLRSSGVPNPQALSETLFQELSKVPVPTDAAVREEVQEIRLKQQISSCIQELPLPNTNPSALQHRNKVKGVLAKRLNEIENSGRGCETQQKIRNEITKYMRKISENVNDETLTEKVNQLTDSLKRTQQERRNPTGYPAVKSNQCAQASDSFIRPDASDVEFRRPGGSLTAVGNQEGAAQTGPSPPSSASTRNAHYMPGPGSFMGMREVVSQGPCPHGGLYDLEARSSQHVHGYEVDDGRFFACPYWMRDAGPSDLDARSSAAR